MRAIAHDAVVEVRDGERWIIAQTTIENETYCVLTALDGWCDCFAGIAKTLPDIAYDDKPLRSLISKMRLDQPVSETLFNLAKNVVEQQRKVYMLAPHTVINQVSGEMLGRAAA